MKIRQEIVIVLSVTLALITDSCSNTKFLSDDQKLYTGRDVVIMTDSGLHKDNRIKPLVESVTGFNPNNSLGGKRLLLPLGLWTYNYMKPEGDKKPGLIYRSFAREPILVTTVKPETRCRKLEAELFGIGYFHSKVWFVSVIKKSNPLKAGITYFIKPGRPFIYNDISFETPTGPVDSLIAAYQPYLSIKKGDMFDLEMVQNDGRKIVSGLLDSGYFYFNQNNLKYTADTTNIPDMIDLRIGKNTENSPLAEKRFVINAITVRIVNEVDSVGSGYGEISSEYNGINIVMRGVKFNPEVITRAIYFRKGDTYSATAHRKTIVHLNSYGIFKFINIRYIPDPDTLLNSLDLLVELTPMKDISLDLEANVVTKSTGFSGPGFSATLAQGNLGRGANRLQLRLTGGFEWQWSRNTTSSLGTFSYNAGISASILFPKMITPFNLFDKGRFTLPQTTVTMGFEILNKIKYYRMNSTNLGFGYQWRKPEKITHNFFPLFVNSIELLKTTPEFDSLLTANPYIKKSFEEQFIVGAKYDFTYDNSLTKQPNGFYFQAGISSSGNLLDLLKIRYNGERPYNIAGSIYSQFMKLSADTRYYRNFRNKSLAFRFFAGTGIPYNNSVVMPYVEQFYSGGSNSIRAFQARYLGPGSVHPPVKTDTTEVIIDQTGDIKLEGNIEYRFKISEIVHGALFIDAGNVWLWHYDETRPGGEFRFDTFAGQLAVGTGFGLRFDFNFFILRTDLGFPLRNPYRDEKSGSNWVWKTGDVFNRMVFNFAIGYPF